MYALTPQHAALMNTGMLTDIFYSSSTSPDAVLRWGGGVNVREHKARAWERGTSTCLLLTKEHASIAVLRLSNQSTLGPQTPWP